MEENDILEEFAMCDEMEKEQVPDEFDPIWDEYVGMPEDTLPWFMKNDINA